MADYNLGRVKGALWYVGNSASDADIKAELSGAGYTPLKDDCYLNVASGDIYQLKGNADNPTWEKQGNIKGPQGGKGETGAAAGFGEPTASASVLEAGAAPTVEVEATGEDTQKILSFKFGIPKGADGKNGSDGKDGAAGAAAGFGTPKASATALEAGATPTAEVTAEGDDTGKIFTFKFGIPKGQNGSNGVNGKDGKTPTLSINEQGELIATFSD